MRPLLLGRHKPLMVRNGPLFQRQLDDAIRTGARCGSRWLVVGQREMRADMGEIKADGAAVKESAKIIEHDITGIKMRIERIERHTGLVKA